MIAIIYWSNSVKWAERFKSDFNEPPKTETCIGVKSTNRGDHVVTRCVYIICFVLQRISTQLSKLYLFLLWYYKIPFASTYCDSFVANHITFYQLFLFYECLFILFFTILRQTLYTVDHVINLQYLNWNNFLIVANKTTNHFKMKRKWKRTF